MLVDPGPTPLKQFRSAGHDHVIGQVDLKGVAVDQGHALTGAGPDANGYLIGCSEAAVHKEFLKCRINGQACRWDHDVVGTGFPVAGAPVEDRCPHGCPSGVVGQGPGLNGWGCDSCPIELLCHDRGLHLRLYEEANMQEVAASTAVQPVGTGDRYTVR